MRRLLICVLAAAAVCAAPVYRGGARARAECRCAPAADDDVTRWGGNEVVVGKAEKSYKRLSGEVTYGTTESASGALVELYTHPEHLFLKYPENVKKRKRQRRVAACVTGEDGRYCLGFIEAGKYELRVSKGPGFNVTQMYVEVDPLGVESAEEEFDLVLTPGT
jgi:hypothetical protein